MSTVMQTEELSRLDGISAPVKPLVSKGAYWTGWVLGIVPCLLLVFSAVMKLLRPPAVIEGFVKLGYAAQLAVPIGIVELSCTILYLIPRTAVLGAILLTGYLGGAIATHVRAGEAFIPAAIPGVLLWLGLFLRDPRVRALIPLRRSLV